MFYVRVENSPQRQICGLTLHCYAIKHYWQTVSVNVCFIALI